MPRPSTTYKSMPVAARTLLVAVWTLATIAALAAIWFGRGISIDDWAAWAALSGAAAAVQVLVVRTDKNQSYHLTIAFVLAAALVLPPALVVLLVLAQHVPEWIKERYAWYIESKRLPDQRERQFESYGNQ